MKTVSPRRIRAARAIAVAADVLQLVLFPLFIEGLLTPLEDALDLLMFAALTCLVGWHPAFLPGFVTKLVPVLDLAPTWTLAVFFATRQSQVRHPGTVEVKDAGPHPPPEIKRVAGSQSLSEN